MHLALVSSLAIPKLLPPERSTPDRDWLVAIDRVSTESIDVGSVWDELVSGYSVVADAFHEGDRCYFVLAPSSPLQARAVKLERARRELGLLHEFLSCGSQKRLAYDRKVSAATVTARMKRALSALGIGGCASRVPPLLAMAAAARPAWSPAASDGPRTSAPFHALQASHRLVSMPRPDLDLKLKLSPALRAVLRLSLDGETHERMAAIRGSTKRTIANQLGLLFQRLQASGRAEVLTRLCRSQVEKNAYGARVSSCVTLEVARAAMSARVAAG